MMNLREKLKSFGERELGTTDLKTILTKLQEDPYSWNPYRIGKEFEADTSSVCHLLRQTGVPNLHRNNRATFKERLEELGYDEGEFFVEHADKTYKTMAEILGVSRDTLVAHYKEWLDRKTTELKK